MFGEARGLVGILTLATGEPAPGAPHVVLLSTGILHRVGTNRAWVSLARALAEAGVPSLRFDYSGIGDSERPHDAGSMRASVERDIAAAIEYLGKTRGAERVVLVGLCYGAFDAFLAAVKERRVVGVVMMDMPGPFHTWRHTAHHLLARVLRPASWRNPWQKLRYYVGPVSPADAVEPDNDEGYVFGGRNPAARERMRDEFAQLLERQVKLYVMFTAGIETNYNHRSQFRTIFPTAARHPALSYEYLPDFDHDLSHRADRTRLVDGIVRWMLKTRFAEAEGSAGAGRGAARPER